MADDEQDRNPQPSEGGLNREEVEGLVSRDKEVPRSAIIRADGRRAGEEERVLVERFDFRNPIFLTEIEMGHLRTSHDEFARSLEARLSLLLRIDFPVVVSTLELVPYQTFIERMEDPAHLSLFKVEPLSGVGILEVGPRLALAIAARMVGGDGEPVKTERHLTEIETDLTDDAFALLLEEWCARWKFDRPLEPSIIGHEVNGRFLQTSPRDGMMAVVELKAGMREATETIRIGVPVHLIEPLVKQLKKSRGRHADGSDVEKKAEWRAAYEDIRIPVTAQWQIGEMTVEELLRLKPGEILPLSPDLLKRTRLCLAGTSAFVGEVGVENGRVAVCIEKKLEKEFTHVIGGKQ